MSDRDSAIYVGRKPVMNYVLAVVTQLNQAGFDSCVLKARGRSISTAVDVAEIVRQRFMKDVVDVQKIEIGSEELSESDGRTRSVSTIEITLKKK
ncbi:MAG: DNA-binding protein Alba [Promethearchaeota archaeon]